MKNLMITTAAAALTLATTAYAEDLSTDAEMDMDEAPLLEQSTDTMLGIEDEGEQIVENNYDVTEQSQEATDLAQQDILDDADTMVEDVAEADSLLDGDSLDTTDTELATIGDLPLNSTLSPQDLAADELIGTVIYSAEDENIGEIGELILADNGDIESAIIDFGGFIGLGEKPVKVSFEDLNIQRDVEDESLRISVAMTEDELEAMPEYEG